jgi:peroxiredoxin Q/BCP
MAASLLAVSLGASSLKVGDRAPDFTLPDTEQREVTLSKLLEKGPVILAFFPKAFTSGCTRELSSYSAKYDDVEKKGAQVVAVSTDDVETQTRFKESVKAPYTLLSDANGKVSEMYAGTMPVVNLVKRIASRATYVIDVDGIIKEIVTGNDAVDPAASIASCPLRKRG